MLNLLINVIRKMRIYPRLIVSFIVIMITASAIILQYNSENYANKVKLSYYKNMEYTINTSATLIKSILKRYEQLGKSVFDDKSVMSLLRMAERKADLIDESGVGILNERQFQSYKNNIGQRLYDLALDDKYIKSIILLIGERQYEMCNINFEPEGANIKDIKSFFQSDIYQQILSYKTQPYWLECDNSYFDYYNVGEGQIKTILLGMNDYNFNDDFNCTLIMNVDIAAISDVFSSYPYDGDGNVLLVTDTGTQISLQQSAKNQTVPADYNCLQIIESTDSSIKEEKIHGIKSIVAYTSVPTTNMFAVNISDYSNLLKGFQTIKSSNYLMVTGIIILAIIVHYIITLSITIPLNRLKKTMDIIAEDNLDIRYRDNTNDEIASIGVHLNKLVDRIKDLIDEVYVTQLRQKELDFRKKNAELNALQTQINPHFIYNTLDIIRFQTIKEVGGEGKASSMILDFSNMLRIGTKKTKDIVPISEEIYHSRAYVKLVNYKFSQYSICINVNFSFDTSKYFMTKLTLQPIVENCIVHGFINPKADKKIHISGSLIRDKIHISIEDNGVGMSKEQLTTVQSYLQQEDSNISNVGLRNVSDRLKLFFGEDSLLLIESVAEKGTKVTVVIPYIQ